MLLVHLGHRPGPPGGQRRPVSHTGTVPSTAPSTPLTRGPDGAHGGTAAFRALAERVREGGVVVLSGAGLSTDSGIPDYRGPSGSLRTHTPMTFQEFTGDPVARRRYWARSHPGWRTIGQARPNDGHRAVARPQEPGAVHG